MTSGLKSLVQDFYVGSRVAIRRRSAHRGTNPSVFVVGAQKGGTTSLYSLLAKSSAFITALKKEVHYYEDPRNLKKGLGWYLAHFPPDDLSAGKTTGEATPCMYSHHVPRLIASDFPKMKFVFLLRDPVERAISHYFHNVRFHNFETESFSWAIRNESSRISDDVSRKINDPNYDDVCNRRFSYVARGRYHEQLTRFNQYFPREQLYVTTSERFFLDPLDVANDVCTFLGIAPIEEQAARPKNVGSNKQPINDTDKDFLISAFRGDQELLVEDGWFDEPPWGW